MDITIESVGADLCVGPWRVPRRGVSGRTHRSAPTRCGKRSGDNGNWHGKRTFPLRGAEQGDLRRGAPGVWLPPAKFRNGICGGGVWSPRPTGATQVVPSDGPPYLGHGLRRPNSVPKFGASVKSSAPTEGLPKPWAAAPTGASQAVPRNTGRGRDSSRRARKPRRAHRGEIKKRGGLASPLFVRSSLCVRGPPRACGP